MDFGGEDAGFADTDVVFGWGEVDDKDVGAVHLAVEVAVPHALQAFLDDFDGSFGCQGYREALFFEDDGVGMVPFLGKVGELVLSVGIHFLESDEVCLLPLDPRGADVGGLLVVEAIEDVVGENLEGRFLGGVEEGGRAGAQQDGESEEEMVHGSGVLRFGVSS